MGGLSTLVTGSNEAHRLEARHKWCLAELLTAQVFTVEDMRSAIKVSGHPRQWLGAGTGRWNTQHLSRRNYKQWKWFENVTGQKSICFHVGKHKRNTADYFFRSRKHMKARKTKKLFRNYKNGRLESWAVDISPLFYTADVHVSRCCTS